MSPSFTWPSISNVYIKRVCIYIKEGESDKSHVMDGTFTLHLSHKIWCKTSVKLYSNKQTDGLSNFDHGFCVLSETKSYELFKSFLSEGQSILEKFVRVLTLHKDMFVHGIKATVQFLYSLLSVIFLWACLPSNYFLLLICQGTEFISK